MNTELHDILSNPALLKNVPDETLQAWILQYPYVSLFHLYALKRKIQYTETDLHQTAFYFNNREKLYFLLNNKNDKPLTAEKNIVPETDETQLYEEKDIASVEEKIAEIIPEEKIKEEEQTIPDAETEPAKEETTIEHIELVEDLPLSISIPIDFQEDKKTEEEIFPEDQSHITSAEIPVHEEIVNTPVEFITPPAPVEEVLPQKEEERPLSIAEQVIAEIKKIQEERAQRKLEESESEKHAEVIDLNKAEEQNYTEEIPEEKVIEKIVAIQDTDIESEIQTEVQQKEELKEFPLETIETKEEETTPAITEEVSPIEEIKTEEEEKELISEVSTEPSSEISPEEKKLSIAEQVIAGIRKLQEERAQKKLEVQQEALVAPLSDYPQPEPEKEVELIEDAGLATEKAEEDVDALAGIYDPIHTNLDNEVVPEKEIEFIHDDSITHELERVDVDDLGDVNMPIPEDYKETTTPVSSKEIHTETTEEKKPEEKQEEKTTATTESTSTQQEEIKESEEQEEAHINEQKKEMAAAEDTADHKKVPEETISKEEEKPEEVEKTEFTSTHQEEIKESEEQEEAHIDEQKKEMAAVEDTADQKKVPEETVSKEEEKQEEIEKTESTSSPQQEIKESEEQEEAHIDEQKKEMAVIEDSAVQKEAHTEPVIEQTEKTIEEKEIEVVHPPANIPHSDEPHTFIEWLQLLDGKLQIQTSDSKDEKEWIEFPRYEVSMQQEIQKVQQEAPAVEKSHAETEDLRQLSARKKEEEKKLFEPNFEEGEVDLFNEIDEEVHKVASESVSFKQDMMTETLAKIYLKQGKPEKALEIYNALLLKFPEKSAYFAALIQKIENEK